MTQADTTWVGCYDNANYVRWGKLIAYVLYLDKQLGQSWHARFVCAIKLELSLHNCENCEETSKN